MTIVVWIFRSFHSAQNDKVLVILTCLFFPCHTELCVAKRSIHKFKVWILRLRLRMTRLKQTPCVAIPKAKFCVCFVAMPRVCISANSYNDEQASFARHLKTACKDLCLIKRLHKPSHLFQKLSHYSAFNAPKIHAYLAFVRAHNSPYAKDFMLYQIALFKRLVCALCQACF